MAPLLKPLPWRALTNPAIVAGLAVWVANDHLLKASVPGLVTGKLSDFAGTFVLAISFAAVAAGVLDATRARVVGFGAYAVFFIALKTSQSFADACAALAPWVPSGRIVADPYDLSGLIALVPAWWLWGRTTRPPVDGYRIGRLSRLAEHRWLRVPILLAIGITTVASEGPSYPAVDAFEIEGPAILVRGELLGTQISRDGGDTWEVVRSSGEPGPPIDGGARPRPVPADGNSSPCFSNGRCLRVEGRLIFEVGPDGLSKIIFDLDKRASYVKRVNEGQLGYIRQLAHYRSAEREYIFVALGERGLLRRSQEGHWAYMDLVGLATRRDRGDVAAVGWEMVLAVIVTIFVAVPVLRAARVAGRGRKVERAPIILIPILCSFGYSFAALGIFAVSALFGQGDIGGYAGGVLLAVGLLVALVLLLKPVVRSLRLTREGIVELLGTAVVFAASVVPLLCWVYGFVDDYDVAASASVVGYGVALALMFALLQGIERKRRPPTIGEVLSSSPPARSLRTTIVG